MPRKTYHHGNLKNALIRAGIEILSSEGVAALSLRRVAAQAGVSHAAPYAHFADKEALIAAISTEGYRRLYERVEAVVAEHQGDPRRQLLEAAWVYVQFALDDPDHFRITLSGAVEREKEYPALVELTQKGFQTLVQIVEACQSQGILDAGPPDVMAVSVWGLVHGIAVLILDGQVSHSVLDRIGVRGLLIFSLNQIARVQVDAQGPVLERQE
ncbi:MAG: TetR/AcrR family transcriptional regulator [Bacteroidota bacterium]